MHLTLYPLPSWIVVYVPHGRSTPVRHDCRLVLIAADMALLRASTTALTSVNAPCLRLVAHQACGQRSHSLFPASQQRAFALGTRYECACYGSANAIQSICSEADIVFPLESRTCASATAGQAPTSLPTEFGRHKHHIFRALHDCVVETNVWL